MVKLIRLPNLILIALTLFLMRYGVLQPILTANGLGLELNNLYFLLLVAAVVLIAAGGYMINDYFDVETDTINCPEKVLIGKVFTPNAIYNAYLFLNILALALAFYVSFKLKFFSLFIIFPVTVGALWFYSNTYKQQFLIGNILVSIFVAVVPMLPAFYEVPLVYSKYKTFIVLEGLDLKYMYYWPGVFAIFAFLVNLVREIVKDSEDYLGDSAVGSTTIPIVLGTKATKVIVIILQSIIFILLALVYIYFLLFDEVENIDFITMGYFVLFLFIPLVISGYFVVFAQERTDYSKASLLLKIVLLFGILYALILRNKIN
jgi:4-hydroxybenzoate polyprenyltransferase